MQYNVAGQHVDIFVFDYNTGAPKTGDAANLLFFQAKDNGAVTALSNTTVVEKDANKAKGWYYALLTQAESAGNSILFTGNSSTANVSVVGRVVTTTAANATLSVIDGNGNQASNVVASKGVGIRGTAGNLGIDLGNVSNPSTTLNLSGTTIAAVSGAVGSVTANVTFANSTVVPSLAAIQAGISSDHGSGNYVRNTEPLDAAGTRTAVGLASANLDTQLAAIQADLPTRPTKGVALAGFQFRMVLSSDGITGATGKTVTATRSLDGGALGACTNAPTELSGGLYTIDLSASDMNGTTVALRFTASGCIDSVITIVTEPT